MNRQVIWKMMLMWTKMTLCQKRGRGERKREKAVWLSFIVSALGAVSRCPTRNMLLSRPFLYIGRSVRRSMNNKSRLDLVVFAPQFACHAMKKSVFSFL
uniref:Uncharacterized protein n=1 Tax=Arundo donax TaxID=35708 RepID=A0A0A9H1R2_ARUDO